jgi:hypothetical protein
MKSFKEFSEEVAAMNTGAGIAGLPPDQPPGPKKKKNKYKVLTRGYIEIAGKRKKLVK